MADNQNDDDYDDLAHTQRLKAAVHYTSGKLCKRLAQDVDVEFNRQFVAVVAEATFRYSQTMSRDLELFAKHARRQTINADDVKMVTRKSAQLHDHIAGIAEENAREQNEKKLKRKNKKSTENTETADT